MSTVTHPETAVQTEPTIIDTFVDQCKSSPALVADLIERLQAIQNAAGPEKPPSVFDVLRTTEFGEFALRVHENFGSVPMFELADLVASTEGEKLAAGIQELADRNSLTANGFDPKVWDVMAPDGRAIRIADAFDGVYIRNADGEFFHAASMIDRYSDGEVVAFVSLDISARTLSAEQARAAAAQLIAAADAIEAV